MLEFIIFSLLISTGQLIKSVKGTLSDCIFTCKKFQKLASRDFSYLCHVLVLSLIDQLTNLVKRTVRDCVITYKIFQKLASTNFALSSALY